MTAPSGLKEARVERLQAAGWRVGGQTGPLLSREGSSDTQLSEQRARPPCSRLSGAPGKSYHEKVRGSQGCSLM